MWERYFRIENEIKSTQSLQLKESMVCLSNFQSITKRLQTTRMNIHESRDIFNRIFKSYPSMKNYLAPDAQIIHSAEFNSAVVKIMSLLESTLICSGKNLMLPFLLSVPNDVTEEESCDMLQTTDPSQI
jgi:hypothetical protein